MQFYYTSYMYASSSEFILKQKYFTKIKECHDWRRYFHKVKFRLNHAKYIEQKNNCIEDLRIRNAELVRATLEYRISNDGKMKKNNRKLLNVPLFINKFIFFIATTISEAQFYYFESKHWTKYLFEFCFFCA